MYTVYVDDNSHYMDESERRKHGRYRTHARAVRAARRIVDRYLASAYRPGMKAERLLASYRQFGTDPFVVPNDGDPSFSAWSYAEQRYRIICGRGLWKGIFWKMFAWL